MGYWGAGARVVQPGGSMGLHPLNSAPRSLSLGVWAPRGAGSDPPTPPRGWGVTGGFQGPRGLIWPHRGGTGPIHSLWSGVHGVEGCVHGAGDDRAVGTRTGCSGDTGTGRAWCRAVAQQQHAVAVSGDQDRTRWLLPGPQDRAWRLLPGIPGPVQRLLQGHPHRTQQLFRIHRDRSRLLLRGIMRPDTAAYNGDTGPGHRGRSRSRPLLGRPHPRVHPPFL